MKKLLFLLIGSSFIIACSEQTEINTGKTHQDYLINSTDSVKIFVREFQDPVNETLFPYPLLLIHGGGPGAIASFDVAVPNGSFGRSLAEKGIKVYLMNIRGWESSTLPKYEESDSTLVIGNHLEAYNDIKSVVDFIKEKDNKDKISLFGWATGGHWGGYFASKNSSDLAHFISLNSLYGTNAPWELKQYFWHEGDTTKFKKGDLFRTSDKQGLVRKWMETIPVANKDEWRDSLVMEGYRKTAVSFGKDTTRMTVPGGYREESFYMSQGRKYWTAENINVPSLIIRTELDFWSRPDDLKAFEQDLPSTVERRIIEIPGTHYVFLDRLEKGKGELIEELVGFLKME
ncbi:Pimeloyl-ACP methyl ester carboxylesterase [Algoriphagus locisalis]|uniref:Pimeloyl-ACP methyl ester carboxylesterase n=1 Tax=Algoriphagus locisalis TaxID=305507 RepID=A0A1I7E4C4_9BACT|nr:alpha/beta fold hydrolase [Algoriphagus locisalis]SFU18766.1 Pimeloyl-ACP methyl ester carboxylesterase [Algoriphagus locisalis]